MCYKVHTHKMSCDIRPVITSTKTVYVNPYETPPSCSCTSYSRNHSISHSNRCSSHGCCSLDVAVYRCPRHCRRLINYHQYVRNHYEPQQLWSSRSRRQSHSSFYCDQYSSPHHSRAPSNPFTTSTQSPWRRIPTFDRKPDFHAAETSDFRFALSELLDIGRILLYAQSELEKAQLRIERERTRHHRSHGAACERVLREWECSWTRRIEEMVIETDDLKLSSEVLSDCWDKYVGLLRKYELLGQRRVGGIVENRKWRKQRSDKSSKGNQRDEEDKPWRYVRRESWDRKDRGREKTRRREPERDIKQERRRERRGSVRFDDFEQRRESHRGSSDSKRHRSWWMF